MEALEASPADANDRHLPDVFRRLLREHRRSVWHERPPQLSHESTGTSAYKHSYLRFTALLVLFYTLYFGTVKEKNR